MLNDGRRGSLLGVVHILDLERNPISVSTMEDTGVRSVFEKDTCKMVRGAMVLMQVIKIGTVYKLLGKTNGNSCNQVAYPKSDDILSCVTDSTMLWHQ